MLSTDLPVTEWWDPEVDYYGVPMSPTGHGPAAEAAWWPAFVHLAEIEWIMTGRTWGWPDGLFARQLTTGHDPLCPAITAGWECDCRDEGPPYLGAWPWPCSCAYYRSRTHFSHVETLTGSLIPTYGLPGISWFIIHSDCPQHGDDAHA